MNTLSVLRPISEPEYASWLATAVPAYADDKVASGQWPAASALELARQAFADLLPEGQSTEHHHIHAVVDEGGNAVGTLWFMAQHRADRPIAYVYDIHIRPEHRRRGHAFRAFQALEHEAARLGLAGIALHVFGHNHEAQALYRKLGYAATNINLYKPVAGRRDAAGPGSAA